MTLTILNQLIYKNQKELVKHLLNKHPALINAQDALGNTPLHYAIKFGHYELANTLMKEYHADVTIKNLNKHSPHENWGGTSYFSRLVGPLREWWPKSVERTPQDQLEKQFTQNLLQIRKNIDEMTKKFGDPEQNKQIIYETLQALFRDKPDGEVRNGTIDEILSLAASDDDLFKLHEEKGESLIILAAQQQDQNLVGRLIDSLLNKNPDDRLNVCMMFLNQILSEKVDSSQDERLFMVLEHLFTLPENGEDNSLLYQRDAKAQTPVQKAFSNHHFKLTYALLEKSSDSLSLSMMDHLINNNISLVNSCVAQQPNYLADLIQFESPDEMAEFLQSVWQKGDESLKKFYFNHATGAAINAFLKTFKQPGYFNRSKAQLPIETFIQLFTQDELDHFITQKLSMLEDERVLELLELQLKSRDDEKEMVKKIIEAKPDILNKQDQNGRTPLHYAIKNAQWSTAVYLMKKGADVTIKNNSHHAPYDNWYGAHAGSYIPGQKAALWSYENTQKTQLNQADEKDMKLAKNREKGSLIMMTAFHQKDVAEAIESDPDKKIAIIFNKIKTLMITPKPAEMHAMSDQDYKRTVRDLIRIFLIEYQVNPNELLSYQDNEQVRGLSLFQHESKNTLLHLAIQKNQFDFVEMLVNLSGPTNIPNADGKTALDLLHQPKFEKHQKALEILEKIKAQQEQQRIQEINRLDVPSYKPNKQAEKQSEAEAETIDGPTTVNRKP